MGFHLKCLVFKASILKSVQYFFATTRRFEACFSEVRFFYWTLFGHLSLLMKPLERPSEALRRANTYAYLPTILSALPTTGRRR